MYLKQEERWWILWFCPWQILIVCNCIIWNYIGNIKTFYWSQISSLQQLYRPTNINEKTRLLLIRECTYHIFCTRIHENKKAFTGRVELQLSVQMKKDELGVSADRKRWHYSTRAGTTPSASVAAAAERRGQASERTTACSDACVVVVWRRRSGRSSSSSCPAAAVAVVQTNEARAPCY